MNYIIRGENFWMERIITQIFCVFSKLVIFDGCQSEPNLHCNYTFSLDFVPNEIPFGTKSIGTFLINNNFKAKQHKKVIERLNWSDNVENIFHEN